MKIKSIAGENFRLLVKKSQNRIMLDDQNTIIVGRNNCGKTSFVELVKCFTNNNPNFDFADFSLSCLSNFDSSYESYKKYTKLKGKKNEENEEKITDLKKEFENKLPIIKLEIVITYTDSDNTAHLEPFITELKFDNKEVILQYEYYCEKAKRLFERYERLHSDSKIELLEYIKDNYSSFYKTRIWTIDSTNRKNKYQIDKKKTWKTDLNKLLKTAFIFARRELDDKSEDKTKELSKLFDSYFKLVQDDDEKLLIELTEVLGTASGTWDDNYSVIFKEYFDDLNTFGYPGLEDRNIELKSKFSPESILKNNTDIFYSNDSGYSLPESYNGLGFSNLIYIILKLLYFYKEFQIVGSRLQMIFIEEPEVHLHPQMQKTFIRNIVDFISKKLDKEKGALKWNVQIVITTHSSHIISESSYKHIRYLKNRGEYVVTKDLEDFALSKSEGIKFLEQYLKLDNCDMFFADKVIMIEGTVERMLLPLMIKKISNDDKDYSLTTQYISIIEVGGAYAYKFKDLLNFIGVKTLIITDLDCVDPNNKYSKIAPELNKDYTSSNLTLQDWLPKLKNIDELLECGEDNKIDCNELFRVAYQYQYPLKLHKCEVLCGRSFEEQFVLENFDLLYDSISEFESVKTPAGNLKGAIKDIFSKNKEDIVINKQVIDKIVISISNKPTFAFDIMFHLELDDWKVPTYIREGLEWLQK